MSVCSLRVMIGVWLLASWAGVLWAAGSKDQTETGHEDEDEEDLENLEWEMLQEEATTVTATKQAQKVEQVPSIVEVITAEEIRRRGSRTVGEALRAVPGLAIIDDLAYWNVGVRGIHAGAEAASDILKVMINGQSTAFRPFSGNSFGHDLIPIEAVRKIEVVRGPGSALYGANAFLGVINIITFEGTDGIERNDPGMHGVALDSSLVFNPTKQNLNGAAALFSGMKSGRFQYFAAGTFSYADRSGLPVPGEADMLAHRLYRMYGDLYPDQYPPPKRYPSPGWDGASRDRMLRHSPSQNDLERVGSAYAIASYALSDDSKLVLDSNLQYYDRFGEWLDFSNLTHLNRMAYVNTYSRLRYLREDPAGLSLNLSLAVAGGAPTADDHIVNPLTFNHHTLRHLGYLAVDLVVEARYAFSADNLLTVGVDYTNDREDLLSREEVDEATGTSTIVGYGDKTFANFGAFLQWVFRPIEGLGLILGSRLDNNNVIACETDQWDCIGHMNPDELSQQDLQYFLQGATDPVFITNRGLFQISNRVGVVYDLPLLRMYTKAAYGSSFKPPSPYQLYHPELTHFGSVGTPLLRPQTADTFEFLLGGRPIEGLQVTLDFFYTTVTDKVLSFLHSWGVRPESRNADVTVYGLEGKATFRLKNRLSSYLNATWMLGNTFRPKKKWDETEIEYKVSVFNNTIPGNMFPGILLALGASVQIPELFLNVNLDLTYIGERKASSINSQLYKRTSLRDSYSLDPYVLIDLTLTSLGLVLLGDQETVLSLSFRLRPIEILEPGYGGIDVPNQGSQMLFKVTQRL